MFTCINVQPIINNRSRRLCQLGVLFALAFTWNFVHAQATGLTLNEALRLSLQRAPLTQAAEASVRASREAAARSDQLPDPMLKAGIENVPTSGPDRFSTTRDFMTMRRIGIEQQWVSSDKRAARAERAQKAVAVEEGGYLENVAKVREETAKAWLNVLYSQRTLALLKTMEKVTADDVTAVKAAHRGAKGTASEVVQAQLAYVQAQDARQKAEQELANARILLTRWTAIPVEGVADDSPSLVSHQSHLPPEELEKIHPMVISARRAIDLADADTTVATRERRPDWTVEATYNQRKNNPDMVSFGVSIPLTVNRAQRQDRDIAEKSAMGTKARMQYDDVVREVQAEIQSLTTSLAILKERLARFNTQLLPPATSQVELATAAYRSGGGSLSEVFNARKMLLEKQMQVIEMEKEAALTWAKLEYHLVPRDLVVAGRAEQ
ncbi:outer membrane protein TolC [Paucimonas lemoignei]|uniref:Outer membrane protein TolC n=1 Tax=Paucimonas lemoignei TaxID=29443 RepID=A0A4R3HXS5_PAULE|nr:TolC family protein [Paucimonas lemoignei]TCS37081.1 outer membrane protein TolC [Paucimonas lemoignei]